MFKKLFLFVAFIIVFGGCEEKIAFDSDYNDSFTLWTNSKKERGDDYEFTLNTSSVFGFSSNTIITVINGKIVSRKYEAFQNNGSSPENVLIDTWVENEENLNTHTEGAEAVSLDEIYQRCYSNILSVDENDNFIYFENENDGLLSLCNYIAKECQDDCSIGYRVTKIVWL